MRSMILGVFIRDALVFSQKMWYNKVVIPQKPPSATQNRRMKLSQKILVLFGIVFSIVIAIVIAIGIWFFGELQLKQDVVNSSGNIGKIYSCLEEYKEKHGSYPAQQNMNALIETLGMNMSDFFKVYLFDIKSATYHAPTPDSEAPVITMRVKLHVFEKNKLLVRDKDGWHYENIDTGTKP